MENFQRLCALLLALTTVSSVAAASDAPTPAKRSPPAFPRECEKSAASTESVSLIFDIEADGSVSNVRVKNSTNDCFNDAAVAAVSKWIYAPQVIDGEPVALRDQEVAITFELLPSYNDPGELLTRETALELQKAFKEYEAGRTEAAIGVIDELLEKRPSKMRPFDRATALEMRCILHAQLEQYDEALADCREALALNAFPLDRQKQLENLIQQMEDTSSDHAVDG